MDSRALLTLAQWLSPAFPVGAFAYSHGLERAIADGAVADGRTLGPWVEDCLRHGAGRSDAILLAHAYRGDAVVGDLALALQPSAERRLESRAQGAAFARTAAEVWPDAPKAQGDVAYPVAVGRAAAALGCPLGATLRLFLQAFAQTLVSAGVRLIPIGQTEGQAILAALAAPIDALATEAEDAPLTQIGGAAFRADIASMRHEAQTVRLYRS